MEAVRAGRSNIINTIKISMVSGEKLFPAEVPRAEIPWQDRMVLPPFLGELGVEIRYFLAAIEPWLRNGWRIPAKRPDLYPEGAAFSDPELFAELEAGAKRYGAVPMGGAMRLAADEEPRIILGSTVTKEPNFTATANCGGQNDVGLHVRAACFEIEIRRAFARRYMKAPRPLTPWDITLLSSYDSRPEHLCGGALSLAPGYRPAAFLNPPYPAHPHVGVQMRRLLHSGSRDSDPALMLAKAREAADHLGLPLLVYGHPNGTYRPEGLPNTADEAGERPLLRFELSMLSQCRLMIAPESGWCDLMCWLRIPTLLEKLGRAHEFTPNSVFHPRVMLLAHDQPLGPQIEALFAAAECLPRLPAPSCEFDDIDWDGEWVRAVADPFISSM